MKKYVKSTTKAAAAAVPKGTSARVGRAVGGYVATVARSQGMPVPTQYAKRVGERVGRQFSRLTGVGEYQMDSGSIMNPKTAYAPRFQGSDDDITITRTEYVGDVRSGPSGTPTLFSSTTYNLNPGLFVDEGGAFQFLPNLAASFTHYKFEQCVMQFRSTSGDNTSGNANLGNVSMCASYVPSDLPCTNKVEALNSQFAVSGPPTKDLLFPIECKSSTQNLKMHQVRTGSLRSTQNIDLFDFARVQVITENCPAVNTLLGELWITYKVRLSKFKFYQPVQTIFASRYRWTGAASNWNTIPVGNTSTQQLVITPQSTAPLIIDTIVKRVTLPLNIRTGVFLFYIKYRFAAAKSVNIGSIAPDGTNLLRCNTVFSPTSAGGQTDFLTVHSSAATAVTITYANFVRVANPGGWIDFANLTGYTDVVDVEMGLIQMNPDIFNTGI